MISALKQAMISVSDLGRSLSFYREALGFEILKERELSGPAIEKLWQLPKGVTGKVLVLGKANTQRGWVRLVEFSPRSTTRIRAAANNWDLGIFDIGFLGEDAFQSHELLKQKGVQPTGIAHYEIPAYKKMVLREFMIKDPSGVPIVFLHYDPPYKPRGLKGFSEVLHSAIIVSDIDKSLCFYRDLLEMESQTDIILNIHEHETVFRLLFGVPQESTIKAVRLISLRREKGFTGRVMLFQFLDEVGNPIGGVDFSSGSIPPHIGLCLLAFETQDIHELESRLKQNAIQIVCPPQTVPGDFWGQQLLMTVKSPEGTLIEFAGQ